MKCKVRLTYEVEMIVDGVSEDVIYEWLACTTPQEAKDLAVNPVCENYEEEIVGYVDEDSDVDYVIEEE